MKASLTAQPPVARRRLAIANWDYSWLLRASGADEDEFHLLPRRIEELAERGFNALRVDAWPHLVAPDRHAGRVDEFTILPLAHSDLDRGSRQRRQVRPRDRLLRLAQAARANGISLWLTSWLLPDTCARRSQVRTPADFVRIWHATLEWLRESEALGVVAGVDFGHQFPELPAGYGAYLQLFKRAPVWPGRGYNAASMARINRYLVEVPQCLRTLYPELLLGLSVRADNADKIMDLDVSELDFLDLHPGFRQSLLGRRVATGPDAAVLGGFCRLHQLSAALTAGGYEQRPRTTSLADLCRRSEANVERAIDAGVGIMNPSYFARPQHRLWQEVAWLRQINQRIIAGR